MCYQIQKPTVMCYGEITNIPERLIEPTVVEPLALGLVCPRTSVSQWYARARLASDPSVHLLLFYPFPSSNVVSGESGPIVRSLPTMRRDARWMDHHGSTEDCRVK